MSSWCYIPVPSIRPKISHCTTSVLVDTPNLHTIPHLIQVLGKPQALHSKV